MKVAVTDTLVAIIIIINIVVFIVVVGDGFVVSFMRKFVVVVVAVAGMIAEMVGTGSIDEVKGRQVALDKQPLELEGKGVVQ